MFNSFLYWIKMNSCFMLNLTNYLPFNLALFGILLIFFELQGVSFWTGRDVLLMIVPIFGIFWPPADRISMPRWWSLSAQWCIFNNLVCLEIQSYWHNGELSMILSRDSFSYLHLVLTWLEFLWKLHQVNAKTRLLTFWPTFIAS